MFKLDFNELKRHQKSLSYKDRKFRDMMNTNIHQLDNGHYKMLLPIKAECLLENYVDMCMRRLMNLKKRFQADSQYHEHYLAFMDNIIDNGYAEKAPVKEPKANTGKVWYIPNHVVYHP